MTTSARSSSPLHIDAPAREAYQQHVLSQVQSSFTLSWRVVNDICVQAFDIFRERPDDLGAAYNLLNQRLCAAHSVVYRLTAFPCTDCPALVRGNSYTKVVGDKPESTQVLVVYYLLRELLKKQIQQSKDFDTSSEAVIGNYLDSFEKLTGGVNLVKCVFTYMHWVWEKLGLPTEHVVLPTETIAMHIWTDVVVNDIKDKLTAKVTEVVCAARLGADVDYATVENVKRLSLNLVLLSDCRQTYYALIVETPYQTLVSSFYQKKKLLFKQKGPEHYIHLCLKAVTKEEFLAKCFLARLSLEKVREQMIDILVGKEEDYLKEAAMIWMENKSEDKKQIYRASLFGLYELLGGGSKTTWLEGLITTHISNTAKKNIKTMHDPTTGDSAMQALRSIKVTCQTLRTMLMEVFGEKPLLFAAMLAGLKGAVNDLCSDPEVPYLDTNNTATALVKIASEEISSYTSVSPAQGNWVADIYGLLEKKDVFHIAYGKVLETRLLKSTCFSLPHREWAGIYSREEEMLRDLFNQGKNFDFASLCYRMLKDVYWTSQLCQNIVHTSFDVKPLLLTKFVWGGLTAPTVEDDFLVPAQLADVVSAFKSEYESSDMGKGKTLSFLPHYSTVAVRMKGLFGNSNVNELLIVSCCQLSILALFNRKVSWTLTEMEREVKVSRKTLEDGGEPLVAAGVLLRDSTSGDLTLNQSFLGVSSGRSILVPEFHFGSGKIIPNPEDLRAKSTVDRERASACEASIIRLLKNKDELSLDDIQTGVCRALSKFDVPRQDVKKALDKLIEKEFIGRNTENNTFFYIA